MPAYAGVHLVCTGITLIYMTKLINKIKKHKDKRAKRMKLKSLSFR